MAYANAGVQLFDGALLATCVIVIRNQLTTMIQKSDLASNRILLQAVTYSLHAVLNLVTVSTYYNFRHTERLAGADDQVEKTAKTTLVVLTLGIILDFVV